MNRITFFTDNQIAVFPLPGRSKAPNLREWPTRRIEDNNDAEFSIDANVGVVLGAASNGLVDIDLDCELACKLAPYFLPKTGWIFGRSSSRGSHYIYRAVGDAGRGCKFNLGREKFAEFRADGQMTVFPPSIHPSGEAIEFETCDFIGEASAATLLNALKLMTICAIIEPHYIEGKRHDIVLALAGTLLAHGLSRDEIELIIDALCDLTADQQRKNRIDDVLTTIDRRDNGLAFTQQKHLAALLGDEAMDLLLCHLGEPKGAKSQSPVCESPFILRQDDQNDNGMAKLFAENVADEVVFDTSTGCFAVYDKGIWMHDSHGLGVQRAFDGVIRKQVEALRSNKGISHEVCTQQSKFVLSYLNRPKGQSAIAQSRAYLRVEAEIFDKHEDAIAVQNGIVNLRSGALRPALPRDYITKRLSVDFNPNAECPYFKSVLRDSFGGDEELITYFQGLAGYWLTGSTNRQEIYFFYGEGANGKSTIINAISNVLGTYAGTMLSETLFDASGNQHSYDLASLRACRLAVAHEAESKFRLNSSHIKRWTGGDAIKARQLYKDPITFRPQFKIVVLCNKKPCLDAYDDALLRRIKLIPFDYVIPTEKRDLTLEDKLKLEAPGILNFLIEGAEMHYREEIQEPEAVTNATKEYFFDQDSVGAFLKAYTTSAPGNRVGKGELFEAFMRYCEDEALPPITKSEFGKVIAKMDFESARCGRERQWKGLSLLHRDD